MLTKTGKKVSDIFYRRIEELELEMVKLAKRLDNLNPKNNRTARTEYDVIMELASSNRIEYNSILKEIETLKFIESYLK